MHSFGHSLVYHKSSGPSCRDFPRRSRYINTVAGAHINFRVLPSLLQIRIIRKRHGRARILWFFVCLYSFSVYVAHKKVRPQDPTANQDRTHRTAHGAASRPRLGARNYAASSTRDGLGYTLYKPTSRIRHFQRHSRPNPPFSDSIVIVFVER